MYRPSGSASAVRITMKSTIVSQPRKVMSEPLPSQQRVQQVRAHEHRGDQTEQVSAADRSDDELHMRSIAKISPKRMANDAIASTKAKMSMRTMMDPRA